MTSFQGGRSGQAMADLMIHFRNQSKEAGSPWVMSYDEPQPIHNDLSDEKHLKQYQDIWDQISKGKYVFSAEERKYDQSIQNWRIFIRYAQYFVQMPDEKEEKQDE